MCHYCATVIKTKHVTSDSDLTTWWRLDVASLLQHQSDFVVAGTSVEVPERGRRADHGGWRFCAWRKLRMLRMYLVWIKIRFWVADLSFRIRKRLKTQVTPKKLIEVFANVVREIFHLFAFNFFRSIEVNFQFSPKNSKCFVNFVKNSIYRKMYSPMMPGLWNLQAWPKYF